MDPSCPLWLLLMYIHTSLTDNLITHSKYTQSYYSTLLYKGMRTACIWNSGEINPTMSAMCVLCAHFGYVLMGLSKVNHYYTALFQSISA